MAYFKKCARHWNRVRIREIFVWHPVIKDLTIKTIRQPCVPIGITKVTIAGKGKCWLGPEPQMPSLVRMQTQTGILKDSLVGSALVCV